MSKSRFADLGDVTLAYSERGTGPALLLLHGNSESKAIFRNFQERIFADFHTYAIDSRGHGESTSGTGEYSIARFAEDIGAFCASLGIKEASVIGYSDGGTIALALASKAPHVVSKAIAISPNYSVSGLTEDSVKLIRAFRSFFSFFGRLGFNVKNALRKIDLMLVDSGITLQDLRGIRSEVQVLYAQKDMIKEDHIMEIAGAVPNASVRKIPDSTHVNIMGKKATQDAVREFLT